MVEEVIGHCGPKLLECVGGDFPILHSLFGVLD